MTIQNALRVALRINSGKKIFIFGIAERLRALVGLAEAEHPAHTLTRAMRKLGIATTSGLIRFLLERGLADM